MRQDDPQDPKSLSRARYSRFAGGYVTSQTHARGADLERLLALADPEPGWLCLDIATGGGHTALKLASRAGRVVAADLTFAMLQAARRHIRSSNAQNVAFCASDAENLAFGENTFDLVTCRIAPHHFPDAARFVIESARVIKPGGRLVVQDHLLPEDEVAGRFIDDFERRRDTSHHRAFRKTRWIEMFETAGLEVLQSEQVVKRHDFLPWAERQGCSPETIEALTDQLEHAPQAVLDWLEPQDWGTPQASFANRHILIAGVKGQGC